MPAALRVASLVALGAVLSACAGADRFSGAGVGSRPIGAARAEPALPPSPPITSAPVETQALPPPPGAAQAPSAPAPTADQPDPLFDAAPPSAPATPPPAPRQIETPTLSGGARDVAVLGGEASGGRGPVRGRDGVIGSWTAREATGGSCRVQLSSSPALDLYRANASGCSNRDLQRVTAWDYRDGEVYLYQPGGSVAARLKVNDGASLSGVIARSGAQLSMNR
jgi:hypothetical protein